MPHGPKGGMVRPGACWGLRRAPGRPVEIRPDVSTFLAASATREQQLDIGQPDVIRPSVRAHCGRVAAPIIRAIEQETAIAARIQKETAPAGASWGRVGLEIVPEWGKPARF
jgi:hypothetical protein